MHPCLIKICQEFETLKGFLEHRTKKEEELVNKLFLAFMECFNNLKEEKLDYPKEFRGDVRLYHEGFEFLHKKFEDIEIRYLMLSDFYDFARLTKKYTH
ncbi:MAG TPA: hypothetical protein ENK82_07370 [Campylobacterales bacterium]|nr:hypothetical protein [Campylobacterales bacterium]HHS93149.1 hypothetical protein [Campylobacterales bacterium]